MIFSLAITAQHYIKCIIDQCDKALIFIIIGETRGENIHRSQVNDGVYLQYRIIPVIFVFDYFFSELKCETRDETKQNRKYIIYRSY